MAQDGIQHFTIATAKGDGVFVVVKTTVVMIVVEVETATR
jgi:hypothetical protein